MTATRTFALILGFALSAQTLQAQDRSRYRDFQLGSDLRSVAALAKVPASEAKTIHQRPAVIQELEWRPPYFAGGSTAVQKEPVQRILFSFYDDQLFRLVINYDRQRTDEPAVDIRVPRSGRIVADEMVDVRPSAVLG